jgi:hypothetical protein
VAAEHISQGSLFSTDFLRESIERVPDWQLHTDTEIDALAADLRAIFSQFPTAQKPPPNEAQTEDDLIWPILARLGWTASLRQQNLAARGREDVPDGLLFNDAATKAEANTFPEEWRRYGFGLAVVESKRWQRPLIRPPVRPTRRRNRPVNPDASLFAPRGRPHDRQTPLGHADQWRAVASVLSMRPFGFRAVLRAGPCLRACIPGHDGGSFALSEADRRHWLRVFALVFSRTAFLPAPSDPRTFHQRAIDEGKYYEERVAENLSNLVFGTVFPELAKAIAAVAPAAPLQEVREAALILLYRLLFILYAAPATFFHLKEAQVAGLAQRILGSRAADPGEGGDRGRLQVPPRWHWRAMTLSTASSVTAEASPGPS